MNVGSTGSTRLLDFTGENAELIGNTEINSKRGSPALHWIGTINNYTAEDKEILSGSKEIDICIAQTEIGEENGVPHLQFYIKLHKKQRLIALKKIFKRAHLEKVNNIEKAIEYCQKEETKTGEWELFRNTFKREKLRMVTIDLFNSEQINTINIIKSFNGEYRKILWFLDYKGGYGKSLICKYFYDQCGALILNGGKANDINFILKEYIEQKRQINTIIFDIPRCSLEYMNYAAIENIYNGIISCNKYESCILRYNPPKKIIVMANEEPDYDKWSGDRVVLKMLKRGTGGSP